jgi:predicted RNA-binding protein with PUA-like domain
MAVRTMKPGDRVFLYHSGGKSEVVGLAEVKSPARSDPKDPKLAVVDLKYLMHLSPGTTLSEIKSSGLFNDWALVRQSRLSTMAAPDTFVEWMRKRYPKTKV